MLRELFADALFLAHLELMVPCQLAIREPFLVGDVFENLELILHFLEIKVRCVAAHRTALSSVFKPIMRQSSWREAAADVPPHGRDFRLTDVEGNVVKKMLT